MMQQQQDAGGKPPDGSNACSIAHMVSVSKMGRQKGALGGGGSGTLGGSGSATEQQAQRCPRCDSPNTKFCYYNNYSLSQPRHFCKNCRRYWTKGGALRNVPVGGGCRKNKRLKHRDPNTLASLMDMDPSGQSSLLSSINGCPSLQLPGFGPSTSSLISDLASEGHRFGMAFPRLHESMRSNTGPVPTSTQDLLTLGSPPGLLGPFDPPFPALTYQKSDPQPLMFHHGQHASELGTPFFDPINLASSLPPALEHLTSFSSATAPAVATAGHHLDPTSIDTNTAQMDHHQLSLLHHMPMHGMMNHDGGAAAGNQLNDDHHQQMKGSHGFEDHHQQESEEMSMRRNKAKSILSSFIDNNSANGETFFVPPPPANESNLWNVSWPEMHAALAGSTAAGAMLH